MVVYGHDMNKQGKESREGHGEVGEFVATWEIKDCIGSPSYLITIVKQHCYLNG